MGFRRFTAAFLIHSLILASSLAAQGASATNEGRVDQARAKTDAGDRKLEDIAETVRKSVVTISFADRDGRRQGLGAGFVIEARGLIATNFHVLSEGRPITVQLHNGKQLPVTAIEASDRMMDLAVLRVGVAGLDALPLGDSDQIRVGQSVVGAGNPLGLTHTVVSGVVSARREMDGRNMIQVSLPIERGNSGGPLLDMRGRVQGILTMKSLVAANLGFALPVNELKRLLKKPNPIRMDRWLTIGKLDDAEWTVVFDAPWRQRAGRIVGEGFGNGFGGRTLCLSRKPVPKPPFEIAVTVKLDDESGAAGLAFHADGVNRHYGFYPSAGQLRLTRFEGPDVYSWSILEQKPSPHYRPGDWNTLRVRIEKEAILCFVNDELVIRSEDHGLTDGKIGLAKFRETRAEFKNFRLGTQLAGTKLKGEMKRRIDRAVAELGGSTSAEPATIQALAETGTAGIEAIRERAQSLEQQANRLRDMAQAVHNLSVRTELAKVLEGKDAAVDLVHAALLVAKLDSDEVDVEGYRADFERLARELTALVSKGADEESRLTTLNKYFFTERGFHGSRADYYNRSNSYLNEVLDDREGLPITLCVLYMGLAGRLGLDMRGLGLPGHFVVQFKPQNGNPRIIDVFEGGKVMSPDDAKKRVQVLAERATQPDDFPPVTKKAVVIRMIRNLLGIARTGRDLKSMLRYLDAIVAIAPDSAEDRLLRAVARAENGNRQGAEEDVDWILDKAPPGVNLDAVQEFRRRLSRQQR